MNDRARARRGLAIYFGGIVLGVVVFEGMLLRLGDPINEHPFIVLSLMLSPALASIVARLVLGEGFRDISLGLRGTHGARMLLLAWLFPLVVGLVAYGIAWATKLDRFEGTPGKLALSILGNLTVGTFFGLIPTTGEEIGWRGYMLLRLVDAGVRRPILVSGAIWGAWHLPMILGGIYAAGPRPIFSGVMFAIGTIAGGYFVARVRLESGSVWPSVAFHSSWNALIQGTFDVFTRGGGAARTTTIWTGESGILVVAVYVLLVLAIAWRPCPVRRFPSDEPKAFLGIANA